MKKVISHSDLFLNRLDLDKKIIIDVGCGTGEFVRWLASQGAAVAGIDTKEMLAKMNLRESTHNEIYLAGKAENLPFKKKYADYLLYIASFHHVPESKMNAALKECKRVLKQGGSALFIEPVAKKGSYYEIVKLIGDESEIQARAYKKILKLQRMGFIMRKEMMYYLERSFKDYEHLAEIFVDDEHTRKEVVTSAKKITRQLCTKSGKNIKSFRYRSICRLNILEKVK